METRRKEGGKKEKKKLGIPDVIDQDGGVFAPEIHHVLGIQQNRNDLWLVINTSLYNMLLFLCISRTQPMKALLGQNSRGVCVCVLCVSV